MRTPCIVFLAPSIRRASISAIEALGRGGVGRGFFKFISVFFVNPRRSREARAWPFVPSTGSTPSGAAAGIARGPCDSTAAGAAQATCGPPGAPPSTRLPKPNFVTPFAHPSIKGRAEVQRWARNGRRATSVPAMLEMRSSSSIAASMASRKPHPWRRVPRRLRISVGRSTSSSIFCSGYDIASRRIWARPVC